MPGVTAYPDDSEEVLRLVESEAGERQRRIDALWKYYRGEHRRPLKVPEGQPDDNIILNLCRRVVDQSVYLLFGRPPEVQIEEGGVTPAEEALDAILQANAWDVLLQDVATIGAVAGHCFVRLVPPAPGGHPRMVPLDPRQVTVFWKDDDVDLRLFYVVRWKGADGLPRRQDIVRDGEGWLIRQFVRGPQERDWRLEGEEPWPWACPPIVDWKNLPHPLHFYGQSDLEEANLNDAVNFIASNIGRILRHHAHPKTIGLGITATEVQETAIDQLWTVPNEDAKIYNLEMQSDLASSMEFFGLLRGLFYGLSGTVDLSAYADRIGQITNFGLRVLFHDAEAKLRAKRSLYGRALRTILPGLLELAGLGEHEVSLHWHDPLPTNAVEQMAVLEKELEWGLVSKQTATTERGRDWEVEQERKRIEALMEENIGARLLEEFERGANPPRV